VILHRGLLQIKHGLASLETDFSHRLPERHDEIGEIGHSINRMAEARQRLESDLRREDRLRAIGRLVAGIAHEIRNPLNSIRLSIQYLEQRLRANQVRPEDLGPVVEEVDRLNGLLTNLLTFQSVQPTTAACVVRAEPRPREAILCDQPVAPVVERCIKLIQAQADARRIAVRTEMGPPDLEARFDTEHLTQVITNLMLNAVEAIGQDGTIDVRLEPRDGRVCIEVHDSGPGLTKEQREHLFEAFYTTKPEGTGLGLAVSRELAASMGAILRYANDRPGATFEIDLPGIGDTRSIRASEDYAKCHDPDC
jgi:signal transduction histidine kinase